MKVTHALVLGATFGLTGCNLGPMEIMMIAVVVILLFGAQRLPGLGQALGETIRGFRKALATEDPEGGKQLKQGEPRPKVTDAQLEEGNEAPARREKDDAGPK